MKARDPYQIALSALVAFAASGRWRGGEPLMATALAGELGLSPTPVREALARLAGEGLVEHRPGRGYQAPLPGGDDIADLYELHRRLVRWALDLGGGRAGIEAATNPALSMVEGLFVAIARAPDRPVLARAHWRTTLQLRPIRLAEAETAPLDPTRLRDVLSRAAQNGGEALAREIDAYHDERIAAASQVATVLRRSAQSIDQI